MPGPGCHRTARGPRVDSSNCDVQGGLCVDSHVKSTMGRIEFTVGVQGGPCELWQAVNDGVRLAGSLESRLTV